MDFHSLTTYLETQKLIFSGNLKGDEALHRIAETAQRVSNAAGVAIGLVKQDRLVYQAGCGSGSAYVGLGLPAALNVSADNAMVREILRVEDAENDNRITASICRQFGARSILMLAIQYEHKVVGTVQILFAEPHQFEEREVRTYQLLAGLVNEAVISAATLQPLTQPHAAPAAAIPAMGKARQHTAAEREAAASWFPQRIQRAINPLAPATKTVGRRIVNFWHLVPAQAVRFRIALKLATAAAVVIAAIGAWIAYAHHQPLTSAASSTLEASAPVVASEPSSAPARLASGISLSRVQNRLDDTVDDPVFLNPRFRRVRVGENEVDYVADDVTVRRYISPTSITPTRGKYRQIELGNDVTIRYFALSPAALSRSDSAAAHP